MLTDVDFNDLILKTLKSDMQLTVHATVPEELAPLAAAA